MHPQLVLGLRLPDTARFDNFVPGGNHEVWQAVQRLCHEPAAAVLYLAGARGTGKSHLLQAACRAVQNAGQQAAYLPLAELSAFEPALLEGLEAFALVALDDLECCAGQAPWEESLFHFYNRQQGAGGRLLIAAQDVPDRLGVQLADLRSRLAWGSLYALQTPDDDVRLQILMQRARDRGLELPEDTGRYLLRRCPRDLPALIDVIDTLDRAALAAQRRLTIPFVREVVDTPAG